MRDRQRTDIAIVGAEVARWPPDRASGFGGLQRRFDDAGDACSHLVLQFEYILRRAVEPVCPEMRSVRRVDQPHGDAHAGPNFANRAYKHVPYAQSASDLLHVDDRPAVLKPRITGDHEGPANTAERGDDLLHHTVDEIFLLGVPTQIGERRYCDRRPVREGGRRLGRSRHCFEDLCGEFVPFADNRQNDARRAGVGLDLFAQSPDQHVIQCSYSGPAP
jgi:hypothetical protein